MKYLGTNLTKDMQDLYIKNHKIMVKGIKDKMKKDIVSEVRSLNTEFCLEIEIEKVILKYTSMHFHENAKDLEYTK